MKLTLVIVLGVEHLVADFGGTYLEAEEDNLMTLVEGGVFNEVGD